MTKRNYRKKFDSGGWVPPPNAEDAAGNPTRGYYDAWGKFRHGESSEEETKFSMAHPGRTVPKYSRLVSVYPMGSAEERNKLERAVEGNIRRTGEPSPGAGSMSTLYPQATSDFYARKQSEEQEYNKGGVVKKGKK
jgi:hypothetical protein